MPAYAEEMGPRSDHVCGNQRVVYDFCFVLFLGGGCLGVVGWGLVFFFFFHLKFLRLARGKGREEWSVAAGWWVVMWKGEKTVAFS